MTFWSSILRKRRKPHSCETCGRIVAVGERSYDEAGVIDGDFTSYRLCAPCKACIQRLYAADVIADGWYLFELPELARDAGEPWPPETTTSAGSPAAAGPEIASCGPAHNPLER